MKYTLPHIPPQLLAIQTPEVQKALARVGRPKRPRREHRVTGFCHSLLEHGVMVRIEGLYLRAVLNWRPSVRERIAYTKHVRAEVRNALIGMRLPKPPLTVTITRFGPRRLDPTVNLPSTVKACEDACAEYLKVDDSRDDVVKYIVEQRASKTYAVEIRFVRRAESGE